MSPSSKSTKLSIHQLSRRESTLVATWTWSFFMDFIFKRENKANREMYPIIMSICRINGNETKFSCRNYFNIKNWCFIWFFVNLVNLVEVFLCFRILPENLFFGWFNFKKFFENLKKIFFGIFFRNMWTQTQGSF